MKKQCNLCLMFLLVGIFAACNDSQFARSSSEPDHSPPKELDVNSKTLIDRTIGPVQAQNPVIATPSELGTVLVIFSLKNMRAGDKDIAAKITLHSVDFTGIVVKSTTSSPAELDPSLLDYQVTVELRYKYVPDVTLYKNQKYVISYIDEDGAKTFERVFNVKINVDGKTSGDATTTVEGEEGHPVNA